MTINSNVSSGFGAMTENINVSLFKNCCHIDINKFHNEFHINNQAGDAIWILTSAFIIFTMQSGFGLLEAGSVSAKNECNIMIKNAVDVIFGTLGYWICGFGFSFGKSEYANGFSGWGDFLTDGRSIEFGSLYAKYFFQLSFATTATTIVSGAMAERTNLKAYILFSLVNFTSYVFPAHWMWDDKGFLYAYTYDVAGCGPVHLVGGTSGLVATLMLKPRIGFYATKDNHLTSMASPTNVVLGTFMLWWGWLGFNCGSTFGVSEGKWELASRAAVTTLNSSVGSTLWCIVYCYYLTNDFNKKLDITTFTNGILAGLVSITGICALCRPWEALIIGLIGGIISCYGAKLIKYLNIDDPVQVISVHGMCSIWGLLSVGMFTERTFYKGKWTRTGILKGGPWTLLGYQALAAVVIMAWAATSTFIQLFTINKFVKLRVSSQDEIDGADFAEHNIASESHTRGQVNHQCLVINNQSEMSYAVESKCRSYELHSFEGAHRRFHSVKNKKTKNSSFLSINNRRNPEVNLSKSTDYTVTTIRTESTPVTSENLDDLDGINHTRICPCAEIYHHEKPNLRNRNLSEKCKSRCHMKLIKSPSLPNIALN